MFRSSPVTIPACLLLGFLIGTFPGVETARAGQCRVAEIKFNPAPELQIAIWVEDMAGNFIDTVFVTRATATYGLGNRPGRWDFNSSILWPYGRREQVLPVWAHRRGVIYQRVVFQDGDDSDLSHPLGDSSVESYYCRPLESGEDTWEETLDTGTCATVAYTDKGTLSATKTSLYPPRNDLVSAQRADAEIVAEFANINDLDAISRATPRGNAPVRVLWAPPTGLPDGHYVVWIEVSRENDFNDDWTPADFPPPTGIAWSGYGEAYRGQPSVVWAVSFAIGGTDPIVQQALDYLGYSDPTGITGEIFPPDDTITQVAGTYVIPAGPNDHPAGRTLPSLGAARLQVADDGDGAYKFRVEINPQDDSDPPDAPAELTVMELSAAEARISLRAPGDDGVTGQAAAYEIRFRAGAPLTAENFVTAGTLITESVTPLPAGESQSFVVDGLAPETHYWIGVRAKDDCLNDGPITFLEVTTPNRPSLEVDACFVATAAWGSLMESHVGALRRFRDRFLRQQLLGELAVEAYYTFGPALAHVIRPSATLRELTRGGLGPMVDFARGLADAPVRQ